MGIQLSTAARASAAATARLLPTPTASAISEGREAHLALGINQLKHGFQGVLFKGILKVDQGTTLKVASLLLLKDCHM